MHKYYAHFVVAEPGLDDLGEFSGVVEVAAHFNAGLQQHQAQEILADNLEVDTEDLQLLHWSRLH